MTNPNDLWDMLEKAGLIRLRWVPDYTPHDMSYVDTWTDVSEEQREEEKKKLSEAIDRDGVWGLVGEYRATTDIGWNHGSSVWGFIGQDDGGYADDIKNETIKELRRAIEARMRFKFDPRILDALGIQENS